MSHLENLHLLKAQEKLALTPEEIVTVFINTPLEDNYNFLQEDLVKLARAFIAAAEKKKEKQP